MVINLQVFVAEHIENHIAQTASLAVLPRFTDSDLSRFCIRKMELTGGNAAEGNALQPVFLCQLQTCSVAACKKFPVFVRQPPIDDGPNRMDHIFTRQIEGRGDLRLSGGLRISLLLHNLCAVIPQLDTGIGMDTVIDAFVAGIVAAGHARVGGIDDGIYPQCGDITLPETNAVLSGRQVTPVGDIAILFLQESILYC